MIYAQIKNNIIVNILILDNLALINNFSEGVDYFLQITQNPGDPGIGWSYNPDLNTFSPPPDYYSDPDEEV